MPRGRWRWAGASPAQPGAFAPAARAPPRRASPSLDSSRDRPRAAPALPRATSRCSRVAVRVGRGVSAFEVNLVRALLELGEEAVVEAESATGLRVDEG